MMSAVLRQAAAALKGSDTEPVSLFVEVLNHYAYYYNQGVTSITPSVLQVCTSMAKYCAQLAFTEGCV